MKLYVIGGKAKCGKNTFGEYLREELKDYDYKWAGSTNQRVLRIGERDDS